MKEHVWLVPFMHYDLGYFDAETGRLEPIDNPFGPKLVPMSEHRPLLDLLNRDTDIAPGFGWPR